MTKIVKDFIISLDWFQCILTDSPFEASLLQYTSGEFTVKKWFNPLTGNSGNRQYHDIYEVYCQGKKFGNFTANPKTSIIAEDSVTFKADNELLYTKYFFPLFQAFLDAFELQFKGFSRIDIAIDFRQGEELNDFYVYHKREGYTLKGNKPEDHIYRVGGEPVGFRLGKTTAKKQLVCYDKTKEILEHSQKNYILDFWEQNGLVPANYDPEKHGHVHRLELRLYRDILVKYREVIFNKADRKKGFPLGFDFFQDSNRLLAIYEDACSNFFEFYWTNDYYEGCNVSRLDSFIPIDFSPCPFGQIKLVRKYHRSAKNHITRYKRMLKTFLRQYIDHNDTDYLVKMYTVGIDYKLLTYINDKLPRWVDELTAESEKDFDISDLDKIALDLQKVHAWVSNMRNNRGDFVSVAMNQLKISRSLANNHFTPNLDKYREDYFDENCYLLKYFEVPF